MGLEMLRTISKVSHSIPVEGASDKVLTMRQTNMMPMPFFHFPMDPPIGLSGVPKSRRRSTPIGREECANIFSFLKNFCNQETTSFSAAVVGHSVHTPSLYHGFRSLSQHLSKKPAAAFFRPESIASWNECVQKVRNVNMQTAKLPLQGPTNIFETLPSIDEAPRVALDGCTCYWFLGEDGDRVETNEGVVAAFNFSRLIRES
ncbi:uncharacterized protein CPUR_06709 [Claviceps purpurea 20.1]|uniref:Uncharacterized protein n=1 Tax=Claviceps purpurea (strain 20.1) TaxID=1111077 RepID=M1WHJ6_CLAP2|nr:uncharacterized protein CPUR_06709 [Claviceps purpurea 20.1]